MNASVRVRPVPRFRARGARLLTLVLALGWITPLRAHDLYSSWAEVFVRPEKLELTFTLARAAAVRLLPDSATLPPITPENFPDYAPRLRTAARDLFEITSAGKPLALHSVEVRIGGDTDITFQLAYARPASGAPLRFVAHYLFHLVDGHTGTIVVNDTAGKDLGWSPVSVDQPQFELRLPAAAKKEGLSSP